MHTFVDPLRRALRTSGDKVAVIDGQRRVTYREFWDRCARVGGLLDELGIGPGERVAIWANNGLAYFDAYVGVPATGRVIVPLNTRHAEPELAYALRDANARVLLSDRDPGALADLVDRVISIPDEWESLLATSPPVELGAGFDETDVAGIFYTGGTTGAAKGVMLTHRNLVANAVNTIIGCGLDSDDVWLVQSPMFHAAGTFPVLAMIWLGATHVSLAAFEPNAALDLIEREGVTATLGVPTMVAALADTQLDTPRDVSTLRLFSHGASPIASEVVRRAHEAFPSSELLHLYGATETAPLVSFLRHEERYLGDPKIKSVGAAIVGVEMRIASAASIEALTDGEVGEVLVRGNNVMAGYWEKPDQTAEVLQGGWYRTGDLGYLDVDGDLYLVDRAKDMIVSGGENVYSTEVEEVLFQHESVKEATVFGIPDDQWGEAVHAVVVPWGSPEEIDIDELVAFCRARIAGYKVPKSVELRTEPLPISGPGKVLKRELRAPHWAGKERSIN